MNILERIVATKKGEVEARKRDMPVQELKQLPFYTAKTNSLKEQLLKTTRTVGIIAEMKKASPSKGILVENYQPKKLFQSYNSVMVEGISILTDQPFFKGSLSHLLAVRELTDTIPLLRKDFIIDSYQIEEAKGYGASVILLIASILEKSQYQELYKQAKELNLDVLSEIHNEKDIEKVVSSFIPEMIGINNRNLTTFSTSIEQTSKIVQQLPKEAVLISESGISTPNDIERLKEYGIKGVLVGESIVKATDQTKAIIELVGKR